VRFYLQIDHLLGEIELLGEASSLLLERSDAAILGIEDGLAAGLLRGEARQPLLLELRASVVQMPAVDSFATQQRGERTALGAGIGFAQDPQLLFTRESTPLATIEARVCNDFGRGRWLRHEGDHSPPSLQMFLADAGLAHHWHGGLGT
jgi:hypothetical protein